MTIDPFSEPHWQTNHKKASLAIENLLSELKTVGLRNELRRHTNALFDRANSPAHFVPESVEEARHDLLLLSNLLPQNCDSSPAD